MNILITGAASGIGYDVGVKFAKKGYHVILTTENEKQLEVLNEKIKMVENIDIFKFNIEIENDIKRLKNIDIDVFISNAAVGQGGSIIDIDMDNIKECYDVNVISNINVLKVVINKMIEKNSGKIIIMSSMISNIPVPFFGIYASTKASLSMIGKCLRKELKIINSNIKVSVIEPGIYKTGFNRVMITNGKTDKYYMLSKSIEEMNEAILDFIGKNNLDSISKKIIKAVEDENPKSVYRSPLLQNILIKLYIKFIKK